MDVYQCAIYLDKEVENLKTILELNRPVVIRVKILTSELPDKVPGPWKETIKPEVSDKIYSRFKKQFFKLTTGDILIFSFLPEQSTILYLNGEKKFSDPGSGLMQALLEQWIGSDPVSEDLKLALVE